MAKINKKVSIKKVYDSHLKDMENMGYEYFQEFKKFEAYVNENETVEMKRQLYIITVIEKFAKAYVKNTKAEKVLNTDYHQEMRNLKRTENLDELYQMQVASDANSFMMMCLIFIVGSFVAVYLGSRYLSGYYLLNKTYDFLIIFSGLALAVMATDTKFVVSRKYKLNLGFLALDILTVVVCFLAVVITNIHVGIVYIIMLFELLVVTRFLKKKLDAIKDM